MRAKYLFDLAHLCNCPPPMVDALRFLDFIQLILDIDSIHAAEEEAVRKAKQAQGA